MEIATLTEVDVSHYDPQSAAAAAFGIKMHLVEIRRNWNKNPAAVNLADMVTTTNPKTI